MYSRNTNDDGADDDADAAATAAAAADDDDHDDDDADAVVDDDAVRISAVRISAMSDIKNSTESNDMKRTRTAPQTTHTKGSKAKGSNNPSEYFRSSH